ncbi:MAG: serine/threonine protein kinase [Acidobacteria bacterium]|nr:MAG: serine/threonine protein kinase [Acidobacteriota bacterium]
MPDERSGDSAPTSPPRETGGDWDRMWAAFHELRLSSAVERQTRLEELARENPELAAELASLLESEPRGEEWDTTGRAGELLDLGAEAFSALLEAARVGEQVGRWQVVGKLGEGGVGSVYRAHRTDGELDQEVALKILRPDALDGPLLQRFARERSILARLDHPHIARIVDAGSTLEGVPYVALELVEGEPIDRWCSRTAASIDERLDLMLQVCSGVAYAHRRLIVHRDLKPTNILVAESGPGGPSAKLLDFGIAKLLEEEDTPGGVTRTQNRMLTPRYASPEQLRGDPITTASDVYSLGVLLYELLTGRSPYGESTSSSMALMRSILETDPPRPSEALAGDASRDAEGRADTGSKAAIETAALRPARRLRGDLDAIVLRCLAKEPDRRYGSVAELADDLRRYRRGLPVLARPDSPGYRVRRFVTRHPLGVTAALAAALLAIGFTTLVFVMALRLDAAAERERGERLAAEQVSQFLIDLFEAADPALRVGPEPKAGDLLERGARELATSGLEADLRSRLAAIVLRAQVNFDQIDDADRTWTDVLEPLAAQASPRTRAEALLARASILERRSEHRRAARLYDEALRLVPLSQDAGAQQIRTLAQLRRATVRVKLGDAKGALRQIERTLDELKERDGEDRRGVPTVQLEALARLAAALSESGEAQRAEPVIRRALDLARSHPGVSELVRTKLLEDLAIVLLHQGRAAEAVPLFEQAIGQFEAILGPDSLRLPLTELGAALVDVGDFDRAEALHRRALDIATRAAGLDSPRRAAELVNLGWMLHNRGELDRAQRLYEESLALNTAGAGADGPALVPVLNNLGLLELDRGHHDAARPHFLRAERIVRAAFGEKHPALGFLWTNQARLEHESGAHDRARDLYDRALALRRTLYPDGHIETGLTLNGLGALLCESGRSDRGEHLLREALAIRQRFAAPDDWRIALSESDLGHCLVESGRFEEGSRLLRNSLPRILAQRGEEDPRAQRALLRVEALAESSPTP